MKRIILVLLGIIFIGSLTGCGQTNNKFSFDKAKEIIEKRLTNLEEIKESTLEDVYNLDVSKMDKYVFKTNSDGDFYAIIKTDNISEVKVNMKDYFDKVRKFNTNYSPERLELLNNRVEKEIDSYLIYIIAESANDIYSDILKSL